MLETISGYKESERISIFNHPDFGQIRTAGTTDKPEFCAADICRALGFANGRKAVADHVDAPDVTKRDIGVVTGKKSDGTEALQNMAMTFVNESGMYALIFGSKLPQAKEFKKWVCGEVLPSIRKHGAYATEATIDSIIADPDSGIKLLKALKDEREQRRLAESKISLLEEVKKEQAPKVLFADSIIGSKSSCLIGELAKIITQNGYEIGQNRLFAWMREHHYLGTNGEYYNIPNQKYIEQGLFELKKNAHSENGIMKTTITPKVTGKGQLYFVNKFLKP